MKQSITLAVTNFLLQDEGLTDLLGSDEEMGPWIFPDYPNATVENTSEVLIVVAPASFGSMNPHNTEQFPSFFVDVWADPTRNPDGSIYAFDADDKIFRIWEIILQNLHLVHNAVVGNERVYSGPKGHTRIWGDAEQIENRTGIPVHTSTCEMQDLSDVTDSEGTRMGRLEFSISTV